MSKSLKFRNEEYAPGARFVKSSFSADRKDFEAVFSEFTPEYEAEFDAQIKVVEHMESTAVQSMEEEDSTKELYAKADVMNKDLNVLSFLFWKAKLPTNLLTKAKNNLMKRNIEGGCKQLEDVVQLVQDNESKLVPFGMKANYFKDLELRNEELKALNVAQNALMNDGGGLTNVNTEEYKKLYAFIQNICRAGKIIFDGTYKEDEYTIRSLIRRMRSGNSGGEKE